MICPADGLSCNQFSCVFGEGCIMAAAANLAEGRLLEPEYVPTGSALDEVGPACRVCGCTEFTPCPGGCLWAEPDLCSRCAMAKA